MTMLDAVPQSLKIKLSSKFDSPSAPSSISVGAEGVPDATSHNVAHASQSDAGSDEAAKNETDTFAPLVPVASSYRAR